MDSSVSAKDEIWFLRVCHHVSNALYKRSVYDTPNVITTSLLEAEFIWNMHWRMASVRYKLWRFREAYYNKYFQIARTGCIVETGQGPQFESRTRQPRRWEDKLVVMLWLVYIERGEGKFVLVCTRAHVHTCTYQGIWIRLLSCPFHIRFDSHALMVSAVHRRSVLHYLCH